MEAPDFTLQSDSGASVTLSDLRGRPVVLYFYPRDDTPGCTAEACEFRDAWSDVEKAGAVVLGVSPDDVPSHGRFRTKFQLPFPLLADPDHRVAELYGVWGEKSMYGRKFFGILRTTFVIDEQGVIRHIIRKPKTKIHGEEILALEKKQEKNNRAE